MGGGVPQRDPATVNLDPEGVGSPPQPSHQNPLPSPYPVEASECEGVASLPPSATLLPPPSTHLSLSLSRRDERAAPARGGDDPQVRLRPDAALPSVGERHTSRGQVHGRHHSVRHRQRVSSPPRRLPRRVDRGAGGVLALLRADRRRAHDRASPARVRLGGAPVPRLRGDVQPRLRQGVHPRAHHV